MTPNQLLEKLRRGEVALGVGNMYPACGIIEGMCKGWDFVWIDGQHGEMDYSAVLHATQTAAAAGVESLVRVPGHEAAFLSMYADLGPAAIMAPMVNTTEEARRIVQALRFPPLGSRSFGGRRVIDVYGGDYYQARELLVVVQIETLRGVESAEDIAKTEGVDCLFFGPDDMKVQMGIPVKTPVTDNEQVRDAMAHTAQAARAAGKFAGCVVGNAKGIRMATEMGYQLIAGGGDIIFLREGAAARLAELRNALES